jgi:hypothetical protein
MTLALRLGRTLHELRSTLTASELKMWIAYDRMSPIGDWRGDVQAAQISAAAFNAQGGKANMADLLLKWGEEEGGKKLSLKNGCLIFDVLLILVTISSSFTNEGEEMAVIKVHFANFPYKSALISEV